MKNKHPELFNKKNYPLSNIFINNLFKNEESYLNTFSKDEIPLIENNKSLIFNFKILIKQAVIGYLFREIITTFLYLIHLGLVIYLKIFIIYIKILILLQTYIEFNK